ncbi:MAG TPA: SDR family NAD(P)-dependent oxidoreductase [Bryobacteraceae bacterium]|jgi:3-oxoacyl-[acyl-carrier protein] reductase|nr:SDR family NAD(P)-dependent oxidoreductase [Bryobacteraceae bacterium]
MNISLSEKAALVTGAGRGIGRAIAEKLAAAGAAILLVDIDESALEEAKAALDSQGARVSTLAGDLTDAHFPESIVRKLVAEFGSVDIIVNNAGYTWDSVIQKTSDEQFQAMLDIHVVAPFRVLRAASHWIREHAKQEIEAGARVMRKVVNITSISGLDGNPGQTGYASGKSAIVGLTKTLAKEWGRYNVTVNAVGFGLIDTRLIKPMDDPQTAISIGEKQVRVGMQAQVREQAARMIPLGRLGSPEDAANAVFFFCSPLSDYVTGEVLVCSGGIRF